MTIRNEGMCIAPWLISMLLASVLTLDMQDTKMRPRGGRFYRPPRAAPLSLKPDEHFQPQRWLKLAGPGGHWLGLDVHSSQHRHCVWCHSSSFGTPRGRTVIFGTLAKLPLCYTPPMLAAAAGERGCRAIAHAACLLPAGEPCRCTHRCNWSAVRVGTYSYLLVPCRTWYSTTCTQ